MEGCLLPSSSAAAAAFDAVARRSKSRPKRSAFSLEKNNKNVLNLKFFLKKLPECGHCGYCPKEGGQQ